MHLSIGNKDLYWAGIMIYIVLANISDALPAGQLLIFADLLLIIGAVVWQGKGKLRISMSGFMLYAGLFTAFCFASMLWATKPNLTVNKAIGVLVNFCALFVISLGRRELNNVEKLLKVMMLGCYFAVMAAIIIFGPNEIISLLRNSDRISGDASIERNAIGMTAAYAIVINLYFILYQKRFDLSSLCSLPSIFLILATGTRKAIIIIALGVVGLFVLKNWSRYAKHLSVLRIIALIAVLVLLFVAVMQLPLFSAMMDRFADVISALNGTDYNRSNSSWLRFEYTALGIDLFLDNPILGVGIGNTPAYTEPIYGHKHYLHNNFVEMLASGGTIGTALYYSIYVFVLWHMWKQRRKRNSIYDICLVLTVVMLVMDIGCVSYYSKIRYLFLLLIWLNAENLRVSRSGIVQTVK